MLLRAMIVVVVWCNVAAADPPPVWETWSKRASEDSYAKPWWQVQVALPFEIGGDFGGDMARHTTFGIRPEVIAAHVTETHLTLLGWGIGAYADARERRSATSQYGGGVTLVRYSGGYAFAPSIGYYKLGEERGVSGSLFVGFRGWMPDAIGNVLGADLPFGLRLDVRGAVEGSRAVSGIVSIEVDSSVLLAPFALIYTISQIQWH